VEIGAHQVKRIDDGVDLLIETIDLVLETTEALANRKELPLR
jgi:hypothetical protein